MPVVISDDLVLSDADDPSGTPWIGYQSLVTTTNLTSVTEDSDHPAVNLANPATHLYWQGGTNTSDEYLTIVTGTLEEIDYIGIAKHNFGSAQITLSVEAKFDDGISPTESYVEIVQEFLLADDAPVIIRWDPDVYSHVRLRMQPGAEAPRCGVLYLGKLLVLPRGLHVEDDHVPIKYGRRTNAVSGMSESGNFLGRIVTREYRESVATFRHFEPDFYREEFEPFVSAAQERPFFWAWSPYDYPLEAGYAWLTNNPEPATSPVTGRCAVELQMRGVA